MRKVILFSIIFYCATGLDLPPEIPKCNRSDPKLNECIMSAYNASLPILAKGIPQFKVGSIVPIKIATLSIPGGNGPVKVEQHYEDVEIYNAQLAFAESAEATITDEEFKIVLHVFAEEMRMEAHYNVTGSVLFLPVTGEGECTLKLIKAKMVYDITGEIYETNGEKYVEIKTFKITLNPEKVEVDFKNLFNGDVKLGAEMNRLLNENWEEIFHDVKHGFEEATGQADKSIVNRIFSKVPYRNLFLA
ncbi:hypothetical protein RI129_012436 [Pyrocoelia pectoralis]|uniref:Protein takeout-like n=1 Tax=Pyrocoelia pectoralis TaxID=417401 RepID=A0AAN7V2R4_9COLE